MKEIFEKSGISIKLKYTICVSVQFQSNYYKALKV